MPRVVPLPLSGGDRKAQAKAMREAEGLAAHYFQRSIHARVAGEQKIREADALLCDSWNAVTFWGNLEERSPTIAQAINGGRPLLWTQCKRCRREGAIDLRNVRCDPATHVHLLEDRVFCDTCTVGHFRQRGVILGLKPDPSDPHPPQPAKAAKR